MNAPSSSAHFSTVRTGASVRSVAGAATTSPVDAAAVLRVQAAVLAQADFSAAATAFVNQLATLHQAQRVCLGMCDQGGVVVVALSGEVDFRRNSELCRSLAAAMEEAVEQATTIVYPALPQSRPRITLAHAEIARRGAASVLSVPLVSADAVVGAMTLEFRADVAPTPGLVNACEQLAGLVAPVLQLKRDADRPWHERLRSAARDWRYGVVGPGRMPLKLGLLALVGLLAFMLYWPVAYRVSAPAHLEGAVQRVLVAPADGYLRQVHVKPGDAVVTGQVLAELADQDLGLERRKWASELAQFENSARSALAKGERTAYVVNLSKADAARAQLALVEQQIARSQIRAPFDGIVIKGDLSQALGAPVQRGDVLLTVAPADEFRLIVEVDERDIGDVRVGQNGALALAAMPQSITGFRVVRVTPVATAKDGRNYYEVEARFASRPAGLRPGLQGVAKIGAGERPLAWVWTHRLVDWARLALWSFGS